MSHHFPGDHVTYWELHEELKQLEHRIMSNIATELAAINASLTSIATGVASLDSQIQTLLAEIAAEGSTSVLSADDQAALDAIAATSAALAVTANAAVTPPAAPAAPATP
jgi:hypothetical protein